MNEQRGLRGIRIASLTDWIYGTVICEPINENDETERRIVSVKKNKRNLNKLTLMKRRYVVYPTETEDPSTSVKRQAVGQLHTEWWEMEAFFFWLGTWEGCLLSPLLFNIVLDILIIALRSKYKWKRSELEWKKWNHHSLQMVW